MEHRNTHVKRINEIEKEFFVQISSNRYAKLIFCILMVCGGCKDEYYKFKQHASTNDEDLKYADVFKPWDGDWKGQFLVLKDSCLRTQWVTTPEALTVSSIPFLTSEVLDTIYVEQNYCSVSPYFQNVIIRDSSYSSNEIEIIEAVNKVQNGSIVGMIKKGDEIQSLSGIKIDRGFIIWMRKEGGKSIEVFKETVEKNTYEIIGYGYYDGDDFDKSPKIWFYGKYSRI